MERKTFWIAMGVAILLSAVGGIALRYLTDGGM